MNQHSGLRPYNCRYCPNIFSDPSSKRRHEKEKHENFQHYCPVSGCVYKNKRKPGLISHLRTEHKIYDPSGMLVDEPSSRTQSPASPLADPFNVASPAPAKQASLSPPHQLISLPRTPAIPALPALPHIEPPRAPSVSDVMLREFLVDSVFEATPRNSHVQHEQHLSALPGPSSRTLDLAPHFHVPGTIAMPMQFTNPWNPALLMPHASHVHHAPSPSHSHASPFVSPLHTPYTVSPSPSRIPSPSPAPVPSYSDIISTDSSSSYLLSYITSQAPSPVFTNDMSPYAGFFELAPDVATLNVL
ncbi:hypothetical protein EXIGLDRAFT_755375 [Exidia glandulosa HHB12029]|uniref:C2H2-type domain-containing protein n=1 Tax=Exidia glandulosa HHB12029 TaxID=1314781 RepID=A0A165C3S8_EXIGL|nr:hypothetical protein EXIGLDRAFT_755375 [Exidia glandulosa HHB12029]